MNILIHLSLALMIVSTASCDSAKTSASEQADQEVIMSKQQLNENMMNEGFSTGTVKYLSDSKCSYVIVDDKTGVQFDPINIQEERFATYKNNGAKVYYKYRPLRMMNRCTEAQPIELEDIKKRED